MMRVATRGRHKDQAVMHRQWASVEQSASDLLAMIFQGSSEEELVKALDAMAPDRLLHVVTHIAHDSNTVLHAAAVRERLLGLAAILRNNVDVNTRNGGGYSPLYQCLCHNSMTAARLLINHGADVNETVSRLTGETLLHRMIKGDRVKAVELLIDSGASTELTTKEGDTPLHYAARYNRPALAQTIIRTECNINAVNRTKETALHVAICNKYFEMAKLLVKNQCSLTIKDCQGMTALHAAVAASAFDLVRLMLTNNSTQINSKEMLLGRTPLLLACSNSNQKMASLLLANGADANLTTNYRRSVLHVAAGTGNNGALTAVIKFTTNLNALAINNKTALHFAVSERHRDTVTSLLNAGANVNLKDIDGNSALHMAASNGDNGILTTLLQQGAQINATNMLQQTPLHVAFLEGNEETGWILIDAGSDEEILDIYQKRAFDYLQPKVEIVGTDHSAEFDGEEHSPREHDSTEDFDVSASASRRSVRFNEDSKIAQLLLPGSHERRPLSAPDIYHYEDGLSQRSTKSALSEFLHTGTQNNTNEPVQHSVDSSDEAVASSNARSAVDMSSDLPLDFSTLQVSEDIVSSTPLWDYTNAGPKHDPRISPHPHDDDNPSAIVDEIPYSEDTDQQPSTHIDDKDDDLSEEEIATPAKAKHRHRKSSKSSKPARKLSKCKSSKHKADDHHKGGHGHDHGNDEHQCGQHVPRKRKTGLAALK